MIVLNPHGEALMEQFRQRLPKLQSLSEEVLNLIKAALAEQAIELNSIEYRIKGEESLRGKLERKGNKYKSIDDVTDLLGLRIVTFYTDDVDKVAVVIKSLFDIDWKNSEDKRKLHELNSFGYNSLHYICQLKEGSMPFEVQIRTALQHVWSAIEHDIGYKGPVKLPAEFQRQFSRLAGMLELADDEFSRLRTVMASYRRSVQTLVASGKLSEVSLSTDSFRSYLELRPFDRLNRRIAAVNQAEIFPSSLMPFLPILMRFKLQTLEDVQRFINDNSDDAYQLALSQLAMTDLDIMSETVGLQNLCLVFMLKQGGGIAGLKYIFDTINGEQERNHALAESLLRRARNLSFMQAVIGGEEA